MFTAGDNLEFGHYRILKELGSGGMGVVYLCRDEYLQREIAIKMLLPELLADRDTVERFKQEARLAAKLEHPNIVTILNIGMENREGVVHHYIAMEYVPGGNLRRHIGQPTPIETRINWMVQLCSALFFAHKRNVVHQDIKPDNIFLTQEGNLKIGDFGLALIATGHALDRNAKGKGSPAYMSPEICRGEAPDHRSDIYSLGAVFYELLTGQMPFKAQSLDEMVQKHLKAQVPAASKINSEVPPVLDKVLKYMMAKQPAQRLQSLGDLLPPLEKLLLEIKATRLGMLRKPDSRESEKARSTEPLPRRPKDDEERPEPAQKKKHSEETEEAGSGKTLGQKDLESNKREKAGKSAKTEKPEEAEEAEKAEKVEKDADKDSVESAATDPKDTSGVELAQSKPESSKEAELETQKDKSAHAEPGNGKVQAKAAASDKSKIELSQDKEKQLELLWLFQTQGPLGWQAVPVLSKNRKRLYVSSADGVVYNLEAQGGSLSWHYQTGAPLVSGVCLAGDDLAIGSSDGSVHLIDGVAGQLKWKFQGSSPIVSNPTFVRDCLLVGALDGSLKCLKLEDGSLKWVYKCDKGIVASPVLAESLAFVGSKDGKLHAVDIESGQRQWQASATGPLLASVLASTDSVYCATVTGDVLAIDISNGTRVWTYEGAAKSFLCRGNLEFSSLNYCSKEGSLLCLDKFKGAPIWRADTEGNVLGGVTSVSGTLYLANEHGTLHSFNTKTGELNWYARLDCPLESAPLVSSGIIYQGTCTGQLRAFTLPARAK